MLLLLLAVQAWAAASVPANLVRTYPAQILRNEVVDFKPSTGHHFSLEAPQSCGSGALNEKNPRSVKCQFVRSGETVATLNVCDDKKTFCRPHELKINVAGSDSTVGPMLIKNQTLNKELHRTLVPGFTEGQPEEIIKQAATRGQPVLVMISTDWCPPCNEAKEYLLTSTSFQKAAQNWFKIYVDGDSLDAAVWEKTVPFRYYPTFVLLNSRMEELGRYNGNLRQSEFEAWAAQTPALVNDPISNLKTRVVARSQGAWKQKIKDIWSRVTEAQKQRDQERLLAWALDQEDRELADRLIAMGRYPALDVRIQRYRIGELERSEKNNGTDLKPEKISTYKTLLDLTFHGDRWGEFLGELCETDVAACKPFVQKIPERVQFLTKRNGLHDAEKDSLLGDEYFYLSEIFQTVGDKAGLKEFALKCVDHFEALKKRSFLKISRAGHQGMVACLELAEAYPREEAALKALIEAYPAEPTFLSRMARMLRKQKKYAEAMAWIERAEELSYGYNWFNLQVMKADTLLELKKGPEAKRIISQALAQISLDPGLASRNQGLVAKLRTVQQRSEELR